MSTMRALDLYLRTADRTLVAALDWRIQAGECWCVIGRNGAGKSTLLRSLAGLRKPDVGSVQIAARSLGDWPAMELAQQRAYLPQARSDAFGYRVIESVLTARHPYHASRYWESDTDIRIACDALQAMDISMLAERDVRTLSGGERQRVAIAAVLAQQTPLLLLDEPANGLDLGHQVSVMNYLAGLCRDAGAAKAVVMVSHDLNLVHGVATHALLLAGDGQWQAGPVGEIMTAPALSQCLGHPIEAIKHDGRTIFLAAAPVKDKR
jgi:iron complex transport system ATP-binding protein